MRIVRIYLSRFCWARLRFTLLHPGCPVLKFLFYSLMPFHTSNQVLLLVSVFSVQVWFRVFLCFWSREYKYVWMWTVCFTTGYGKGRKVEQSHVVRGCKFCSIWKLGKARKSNGTNVTNKQFPLLLKPLHSSVLNYSAPQLSSRASGFTGFHLSNGSPGQIPQSRTSSSILPVISGWIIALTGGHACWMKVLKAVKYI